MPQHHSIERINSTTRPDFYGADMILIEKIADLISSKRLGNIQNVRDESSDKIRIVIEPRTRNVDKEQMMRSLYKFTDLETKIPINLKSLTAVSLGNNSIPANFPKSFPERYLLDKISFGI